VQTFLPFPDFAESAECLDRQRLGKQRLETFWIMQALMIDKGPVSHPATLMWRRYEWALLQYQDAICREWVSRGYKDNLLEKTQRLYFSNCEWTEMYLTPHWLNGRRFHQAHQYKLLKKDPIHYYPYFGDVGKIAFFYPEPMSPYQQIRADSKRWAEGWMD
jgi:hypothetical protein